MPSVFRTGARASRDSPLARAGKRLPVHRTNRGVAIAWSRACCGRLRSTGRRKYAVKQIRFRNLSHLGQGQRAVRAQILLGVQHHMCGDRIAVGICDHSQRNPPEVDGLVVVRLHGWPPSSGAGRTGQDVSGLPSSTRRQGWAFPRPGRSSTGEEGRGSGRTRHSWRCRGRTLLWPGSGSWRQ